MAGAERRKLWTAVSAGLVALGMVGASFAAVPLYRLFCQVTGYGGATQRAEAPTRAEPLGRIIHVRFDSSVAPGLAWRFKPVEREIAVHVGENALAFYRAENTGARRITGTATFNVTPDKAGAYFNKIDCFCFSEQALEAGEVADMPVTFFVDPAIMDDRNLDDVNTITLSYTFFRSRDDEDDIAATRRETDKQG